MKLPGLLSTRPHRLAGLALADAASPEEREPMKGLPEFFSAEGLHAEQFFATSTDGTKVPYFLVSKKAMKLDGSTPTLLYGYGGFEAQWPASPMVVRVAPGERSGPVGRGRGVQRRGGFPILYCNICVYVYGI